MSDRLTVTFALPHGGEHKQRVLMPALYGQQAAQIVRARKVAERRGIKVANVLRIEHRGDVLWHHLDTAKRFGR